MTEIPEINLHQIQDFSGKTIKINGWVHGLRGSNKLQFLQLRNNGQIIQVVAERENTGEELFSRIKSLAQETSVEITGKVKENSKSATGFEIILSALDVIGISENYPITPKEHGPDFLHNHRHLWLRSKRQLAIMAIRNELVFAIRRFFYEENFLLLDTPILTGSIGESAGTLFSTKYFDLGEAYLAQTGQLYLESGIFAHNNVYCFGPTFRAEKSKTKRHLTEFWMLEAEMAFTGNSKSIDFQERFVKSILSAALGQCKSHLQTLERDSEKIEQWLEGSFTRITYDQAVETLQNQGFTIEWGDDINAEGEKILTDHFDNFVFVMNYPAKIKAFYMKTNPDNDKTVLCADLIAPEGVGEIIGGSEREENLDILREKIRSENLPEEEYGFYLDLRKYGSVPHSGFGLGLERLISFLSGTGHVRECIPFPRMIYRLNP